MNQHNNQPIDSETPPEKKGWKEWLKRIGILGFLFFLIKGLVWLVIFFFAGSKMFEGCN
jgi:hypothetical protein